MYRIAGVRHHTLGVILESLYDFQGTRMRNVARTFWNGDIIE